MFLWFLHHCFSSTASGSAASSATSIVPCSSLYALSFSSIASHLGRIGRGDLAFASDDWPPAPSSRAWKSARRWAGVLRGRPRFFGPAVS